MYFCKTAIRTSILASAYDELLSVHYDELLSAHYDSQKTIFRKSEAFASDFLENRKEMFPQKNTCTVMSGTVSNLLLSIV